MNKQGKCYFIVAIVSAIFTFCSYMCHWGLMAFNVAFSCGITFTLALATWGYKPSKSNKL